MRLQPTLRLAGSTLAALSLILTSAPAHATYTNGRIAFVANVGRAGRWDIYTMRPDGSGLRRLVVQPTPDWPFASPDWSTDGRQILFTSPDPARGQHTQVYRVDSDGTNLTEITHDRVRDNDGATWSPDGSKILVTRAGAREHAIWVMDADGAGATRLTNGRYDSELAVFTPDGQRVVYMSQARGMVSAIWIMNADGSDKRRLTPAWLEAGYPDVSPDGSHIVFTSNNATLPPVGIYTMRIDGSEITRLTHPGCCHRDGWPKYSPDGTKVVFITDRNYRQHDGTDIYEVDVDGANLRQVTTNLTLGGACDEPYFHCVEPDWGPRAR
jgi:Tol biopolymer transport system component